MNNFCVMPWMHIHTRPSGDVSPCCIWDTEIPLGNIKKEKVINIINQKEFKELRKSMLKNESLQGCIQCNEQELVTGQSYRSEFNNIFNRYIDDFIGNTNEDGSYDDFKMLHMNIRFSNLCNFGCRSCGSINSSFIGQEEKIKYPVINILDSLPNYKEEVFGFLKDVKWINFAGGESMLIKEHWEVLDKLIEIENFDTHITFVTNVSKLEYNQKSIITYAKKI